MKLGTIKTVAAALPTQERRSTALIMLPGRGTCERHLLIRDELGNCPACKGGR